MDADFPPLSEQVVHFFDPSRANISPGRRLRVFAALLHRVGDGIATRNTHTPFVDDEQTYGSLYTEIERYPEIMAEFAGLPLRMGPKAELLTAIPEKAAVWSDPELHNALQDLGDEINEDIHEACFAFDDPDIYYPGIDDGIEPVSDEHIALVMWAMQRELDRELRPLSWAHQPLPAVVLADLPPRIQRALAERRRFRYLQYGITREVWRRGTWSLWDVPEDPEWVPRRAARLCGVGL